MVYGGYSIHCVLFKKLNSSQLGKKFPHFMEHEVVLLHSQGPATCPYPEPDQSCPWLTIPHTEVPS